MNDDHSLEKLAMGATLGGAFSGLAALARCSPEARKHLLFAHHPEGATAATLAQRRWITLSVYLSACGPYQGEVMGRFWQANCLWLATPGVQPTSLPHMGTPAPTLEDGGTVLQFDGPLQKPGPFTLSLKIPNDDWTEARRRLCLSIPGDDGFHKDLDGTERQVDLEYPSGWKDDVIRLLSVEPSWKLQLKKGEQVVDVKSPWTDTPVGQSGRLFWDFFENDVKCGHITRYKYDGSYLYGLQGDASTTTYDLATTHSGSLGHSRRIIFKACRDIEGACESVASYDGPKLSWGINQWNRTELWQILAYVLDFYPGAFASCFGRFGIGLKFSKRADAWVAGSTYSNVLVYRIPCCGSRIRSALDAIHDASKSGKVLVADSEKIGKIFELNFKKDTTSYAMHAVFRAAGGDPRIQQAQAEWMSFRISSVKPKGKKVDVVLDQFLKSLGSNVSSDERHTKAKNALGADAKTLLDETFSDDDASLLWTSWAERVKSHA